MTSLSLEGLDALIPRGALEAMVLAQGGPALAERRHARNHAQHRLMALLSPEQRQALADAADASADGAVAREDALLRVALLHGMAVGAAWIAVPEEDPEAVARTAARTACAVLTSAMTDASAIKVIRAALEALGRVAETAPDPPPDTAGGA